MRIKLWLTLLFISMITACAGQSTKKLQSEKQEKEAAVINVQLASGYIQRGDLEVAEKKLLKAIEFDDEYVPAYTTLAVLMAMLGKADKAEDYYLEALDLDPKDPELQNNYGAFLCNIGKLDDAFVQFRKAMNNKFYATPEVAHANMAYCIMEGKKQGKRPNYYLAEKHLRTALNENPNLSTALLAMGELGIETKKYLMARAYMQRYHAIVKPDAHSLWIQIQAEHALGDKEYYIKLSKQLLKAFPISEEAELVKGLSDL